MDILKNIYPNAFKATELKDFIIALAIYVLIDLVCGVLIGFLVKFPVIWVLFSILGSVINLYALIGIILSVLVFAKVIE